MSFIIRSGLSVWYNNYQFLANIAELVVEELMHFRVMLRRDSAGT